MIIAQHENIFLTRTARAQLDKVELEEIVRGSTTHSRAIRARDHSFHVHREALNTGPHEYADILSNRGPVEVGRQHSFRSNTATRANRTSVSNDSEAELQVYIDIRHPYLAGRSAQYMFNEVGVGGTGGGVCVLRETDGGGRRPHKIL